MIILVDSFYYNSPLCLAYLHNIQKTNVDVSLTNDSDYMQAANVSVIYYLKNICFNKNLFNINLQMTKANISSNFI